MRAAPIRAVLPLPPPVIDHAAGISMRKNCLPIWRVRDERRTYLPALAAGG
jgi:hypothetical protein